MNGTSSWQPGSWQRGRGLLGGTAGSGSAEKGRCARRAALPSAGGALLLALLGLGCQGSVQAEARVSGASEESDEAIESYNRPLEDPQKTSAKVEDAVAPAQYALLGARHDLTYVGPRSPVCACLAVALRDRAQDAAFQWELEAPRVEPSTQWIIALSSNDVACDSPPSGTLGASYQGYGTEGNDVVVYVEALGEGRPPTNGAIIPRPKPSGSVYIESTNAIYGKPLEGKSKRCKLPAPADGKP